MSTLQGQGLALTPPITPSRVSPTGLSQNIPNVSDANDTGIKFEQLMWSQMLRHSGLEEAFTKSGGEAVSAFSQFIVESIAEDLAKKHPLGLSPAPVGHADPALLETRVSYEDVNR